MNSLEHVQHIIGSLDWNREPANLYAPIAYAMQSGGKRLRPQLVLMAADLFGGVNNDVISAAAAIEIFHNFTLLHDDVMDNAPTRRGRPTVHIRWDANTAILSGDQMLIEAYKHISNISENKLPQALALFNRVATEVCEGQQMDMDLERLMLEDAGAGILDKYLTMIRLKTSVLLATALHLGAFLAGASEEDCSRLYNYGINTGIAFQIEDDMLDVYGDESVFGKTLGGDIQVNKKTFLLLSAFRKATGQQRSRLLALLNDRTLTREDKFIAVKDIYDSLDIRHETLDAIRRYTISALDCLAEVNADRTAKQPLITFAEQLMQRQV